jgi:PAS domain S-box-containing protein
MTLTVDENNINHGANKEEIEMAYNLVLQNAGVGMAILLPDGTIAKVNQSLCELLGFSENELLAFNYKEISHPEDFERETGHFSKILDGDFQSYQIEKRYFCKNKTTIWTENFVSCFRNKPGIIQYLIIQTHCIENYKNSLEKLAFERYLMDALMDNISGSIYFKDKESRFLRMSQSQVEKFGVEKIDDIYGKTDFDFFSLEHAQQAFHDEQNIIRTKQPLLKIEKETWPNKPDTWVSTCKVPLFDKFGNILGTCGISIDITGQKDLEHKLVEQNKEYEKLNQELRQSNIDLEKAKKRAEESDMLKSAFMQNMSHEIRTPMNAIIGFSEMLDKHEISPEKRKKFATVIKNSTKQLLGIVNDILTISSLDTKQEKLNLEKISLNQFLTTNYEIFKQEALNKGIDFTISKLLAVQNDWIYTDLTKLNQIISNLISNSLKFTEKGFVEIGCELKKRVDTSTKRADREDTTVGEGQKNLLPQSPGTGYELLFFVCDSGIGIERGLHNKIFERFRQADLSISRKYGGTGLGLAISKGFVELLGGQIWVKSELGKGATFYFTIPYLPVETEEKTIENIPQMKSKTTILVAEDEKNNFLLIQAILEELNFKIIHARNGIETIELCQSNPEIGVVLMDIRMPEMDGYSATKLLKETRPDLVIIAQTAYALPDEIKKFSGVFDGYITKPIDMAQLLSVLAKFIV